MQRELFMNVLNANATRRDAKQYLARFKPPKAKQSAKPAPAQEERNARFRRDQDRLDRIGVNLGGLYSPARAIANSPQFTQHDVQEKSTAVRKQAIHVALVCLRAPERLDDATLEGLATTLSQLVKLDMRIVMVLDLDGQTVVIHGDTTHKSDVTARRTIFAEQAERLSQAIRRHSPEASRFVTGALEVSDVDDFDAGLEQTQDVHLAMPELVLHPLARGIVPILPSLAYTPTGQLVSANVSDVMTALAREFSGVHHSATGTTAPLDTLLDRIIVLDEAGGTPSKDRKDAAHVFINLEQEQDDIQRELTEYASANSNGLRLTYKRHQANLSMLQKCLAILPSASSALIISPQEVAISSQAGKEDEDTVGAGTRRQKNTLIHNLLTNKPMVSPSLPTARLPSTTIQAGDAAPTAAATATLVKRGMPLTIIPSVDRRLGWQLPHGGRTSLTLEDDPQVDFPRLLHLIEDSFRRKLDVRHYLDRIQGRIAGLIVAGEYEGGAILTWEQPPGTSDPSRLVPYLDKFAVLQSSQGSSGVADILFQAMVRSCFPQGVCWRSRKDNPVNKWYFERAAGSWQIPGSNWTMFWTGEGVVEEEERWKDYVGVCRDVAPSWADAKKPD